MQNFAISPKDMVGNLAFWLATCFILSGLKHFTMLLLWPILMPSFLFIMGWTPALLNVPRPDLHKELALC